MDKRRLVAVALAVLVGLHGVAGTAMADASVTVSTAEAAASSGDSVTRTVTYTFTASSNQSVTANGQESRDGGNVVFEFVQWTDLTTGQSGSSTSWTLQAGHEYEVVFETTVHASAYAQTYYADVFDSGPYGQVQTTVVEPQFGSIYTQETELVFESDEVTTTTKSVTVSNVGAGSMKPTNVTFSNVPEGFTVDYSGLSDEIRADGSDEVDIQISADPSVEKGTYQFEATVNDNLGNSETFPVEVTVSKPPVFGIEGKDSIYNVGDVLVGSEKTMEFVVEEEGGYSGIDGVSWQVTSTDQFGSISFDDLSYLSTEPGENATAKVTVSVSEHASQHNKLRWTVYFEPDNENGVGKQISFRGRVIYPARFGSLSMTTTSLTFDEPKSEVTSYTDTVTVTVPNEGDVAMNLQDVTAQADSNYVSAAVVDSPESIEGLSSGTVEVQVEADPEAPEGNHTVSVTVDAEKAGKRTINKQVHISHEVSLSVEKTSLEYGDVIVTKNITKSTDIAESLEYENVENVQVEQVSGPDEWLTVVERPPSTLTAGEAAPLIVALQFDTSAEMYRTYTWKFRVSGEDIESKTITVTATAKPYSFDQIRDPLSQYDGSDWRAETASGMVDALDTLEKKLKGGGDVSRSDLSTAIAAGRATLLFIDSVENARETMNSEGNEAAQGEVVQVAATYNMLDSYVSKLEDPELRSAANRSRSAAVKTVDSLVGKQTDYYRSQLEANDTTLIERAHVKRQLALLASLKGDDQRAKRLRTESAKAFETYAETVKRGNQKRQRARTLHGEMRSSMLTVVAGQPLLLNPAKWDAFDRKSASVLATYDEATAEFERAGAQQEAQSVREERNEVASRLEFARYSLYAATGVYALLFLGVLAHIARNTYAYVRDARAAVTGDFLVAS